MKINSLQDIYKFTLKLYDELLFQQQHDLAEKLAEIADDCYSTPGETIIKYTEILLYVQANTSNLPESYRATLEKAIKFLQK